MGLKQFVSGTSDVVKFFIKLHQIYISLNAEGAKELIFKEPSALMAKLVFAIVFGSWQQRRGVPLARSYGDND
jgi:hypothetical protein